MAVLQRASYQAPAASAATRYNFHGTQVTGTNWQLWLGLALNLGRQPAGEKRFLVMRLYR